MKNTFIDSTGKLQIVLASAVATSQLQWTCSYYDKTITGNIILESSASGVTNSTTAVDICTAPASGHIRVIKNITVYNADTASSTVIIQLVDAGGTRVLVRNSLTTLASRSADDMSFYTDISGKANTASPTFTGTVTTPAIKITTGAGTGKVLTSDADGDATWETAGASGASFWTAVTATRVGATSCTVATDLTAIFKKGMVVKWQESGVDHVGMVSIPSTYGAPNTTITIIGDAMDATPDAGTFKYMGMDKFIVNFAVAGTIGTTGTDIANAWYADEPYRVLGAEINVGTVASTSGNTVIDINIGGTTCFTAKPTIAYNILSTTTPFTADNATALALNDRVTIDIDTVTSTTYPVDLYVKLLLIPTRYLFLT